MTNPIRIPTEKNMNSSISPTHQHQQRTRVKFGQLLHSSEPNVLSPLLTGGSETETEPEDAINSGDSATSSHRHSNASDFTSSTSSPGFLSSSYDNSNSNSTSSPTNNYYYAMSPAWAQTASSSPYLKSPWIKLSPLPNPTPNRHTDLYFSRGRNCLIGSLVREEGHVYSLAVRGGVLYTGSESRNIRVWRDFHDAGGFKCGSGLVKAIVVSGKHNRVFTGHQDGKIRVWSEKGKRVGTLPKLSDFLRSSVNPNSYVVVRRHHKVPRIRHYDAVSCLSLSESSGLMYSGSWDKTIKVWRVSDGRCLESIDAHDDAINSIAVGFGGLVFSGSADGTVKVWRKELQGRNTRHFQVKTLLKQENAVTSLAVADGGGSGGGSAVLYAGSSDGLVNFWEREKEEGEMGYGGVLRGHKLAVLCLATAGCLVLSGSADKTICVWRREKESMGGDHSCLAVLSGHSGPVKCLAVEEDPENENDEEDEEEGKQWIVYSGSLDKSVRIWRVSEDAPGRRE